MFWALLFLNYNNNPISLLFSFSAVVKPFPLRKTTRNKRRSRKKGKHTSPIRRMFSVRSLSEKPRSLFRPKRTLSPSRRYAASPRCRRCCSSAVATVDFPEADRPVNQSVKPFCLRRSLRSARERDGCQVMLLYHYHCYYYVQFSCLS